VEVTLLNRGFLDMSRSKHSLKSVRGFFEPFSRVPRPLSAGCHCPRLLCSHSFYPRPLSLGLPFPGAPPKCSLYPGSRCAYVPHHPTAQTCCL